MIGDVSPINTIVSSYQEESGLYSNMQSLLSTYGAAQSGILRGVPITPLIATLSTYPTQLNSMRMQRSLAEGQLKREQEDLENIFRMIGTA